MKSNKSSAKHYKHPKSISGIIDKVIASLGLTNNYNGWRVVSQWPEIVGEPIATKSRAVHFSEGVLYVAVPDAVWRQELAMRIGEILKTIHSYPSGRAIKQVRLIMGERGIETDGNRRPGN